MSTNSNIGLLKEDGTVDYIYCHFDGYVIIKRDDTLIEGVGMILHKHYNTLDKILLLLNFGDIKYLESYPSKCKYLNGIDYEEEDCYYTTLLIDYENRIYPLYKYLFKNNKWFVKYHNNDWINVYNYKENLDNIELKFQIDLKDQ